MLSSFLHGVQNVNLRNLGAVTQENSYKQLNFTKSFPSPNLWVILLVLNEEAAWK